MAKVLKTNNMANTPFKMKGSPMQRNFGIGSPMTKPTDPTKDQGEKKQKPPKESDDSNTKQKELDAQTLAIKNKIKSGEMSMDEAKYQLSVIKEKMQLLGTID